AAPIRIVHVKEAVLSERIESPFRRRLRTLVQRMSYVSVPILGPTRMTILYGLRPIRPVGDSDAHPVLVSVPRDQIPSLIIDGHLLVRPARRLFVLAVFAPDRRLSLLPDAAAIRIVYLNEAFFSERFESPLRRWLRTLVQRVCYVSV